MNLTSHIRLCGVLLLLLACSHPYLVRHLGWRKELASVSLFTRQVFFVHMSFIVIVLVMMGVLSTLFTDALLERSRLAPVVLWGFAGFWAARLWCQWFVYDRNIWWGNRLNSAVHVIATALWIYLTCVFGIAAWRMS